MIFVVGPVFGAGGLVPHTAEYKVRISVVSGRLNTELRETDSGYVARHLIEPTGMSRLVSRGEMDVTSEFSRVASGILPDRYHAIDTIRDDPPVDLSFDWSTNTATGTVGSEDVVLHLDGLAYDNVSIQYALMSDLQNGKVADQYVLFDVDKMRIANVRNAGTRQVETKAGTYTAVGIQHQKEGSSRVTTLWCVEALGYLPVVIEQHRKGKLSFRATLVSYSPLVSEGTLSPAG
ncbi:MAG TPA: DUF3108 domain-containing protein [Woeseiaceae bacterium]|nr:DUF3108 domain-containing protein [Woeseiaceae bacterium]